jgi:hypothetical protein
MTNKRRALRSIQAKADYRQPVNNLLNLPTVDIVRSLQAIGGTFNEELERQIP